MGYPGTGAKRIKINATIGALYEDFSPELSPEGNDASYWTALRDCKGLVKFADRGETAAHRPYHAKFQREGSQTYFPRLVGQAKPNGYFKRRCYALASPHRGLEPPIFHRIDSRPVQDRMPAAGCDLHRGHLTGGRDFHT
ncbi:hypothetical protein ABIE63_002191 [Limibacillus sp. MBR-115]